MVGQITLRGDSLRC